METILVTGGSGFIGAALIPKLINSGRHVRASTRREVQTPSRGGPLVWHHVAADNEESLLAGCSSVVHLAARVHVMREQSVDPLAEFRRVNVFATERLARLAALVGVRRFIFLSSIKVNGEETTRGQVFHPEDAAAPEDAYGISKNEAEQTLLRVADETGMEVVIIRPPLVYGPGVKGNFLTMLNWLQRGLPLPLASLNNLRSLVGVDNLCDLILTCLSHSSAANETFFVSDGRDISTPQLLRLAGDAMGHPAHLFPCPPSLLLGAAAIIGKSGAARRLCGSLQLDIEKTELLLGWHPPLSIEEGLCRIFGSREKV